MRPSGSARILSLHTSNEYADHTGNRDQNGFGHSFEAPEHRESDESDRSGGNVVNCTAPEDKRRTCDSADGRGRHSIDERFDGLFASLR